MQEQLAGAFWLQGDERAGDAQREGWELEEEEEERAGRSRLQLLQPWSSWAATCAQSHPRKTLLGLLSCSPSPVQACPPAPQPPLLPRSWRALRSPGPSGSLHVGDITAGCHGKARLSKTRPLGLIPCVSGNEGFIAHLCNGAETAGAGTAAPAPAEPPRSRLPGPRLPGGETGTCFLGLRG